MNDLDDDFETEYEKGAVDLTKSTSISVSTLDPSGLYKHKHKTMNKETEAVYYAFSSATTSFVEISNPSQDQKDSAISITSDLTYRYSSGGKTWSFVYTKCRASGTKEVLGSGYSGTIPWKWSWSRTEIDDSEPQKLAYITISKNNRSVAYGFPDLKRFIHSYKELYTDSMEFVGAVCQFATSEKDSVNINGVSLKTVYDELAKLDGFNIYSSHLATAWKIYLKAKKLRDNSHYVKNDCYNTYLARIGQSLALEHKGYFTRAKNAMWTAQAFAKHYSDMVAKGTGK